MTGFNVFAQARAAATSADDAQWHTHRVLARPELVSLLRAMLSHRHRQMTAAAPLGTHADMVFLAGQAHQLEELLRLATVPPSQPQDASL